MTIASSQDATSLPQVSTPDTVALRRRWVVTQWSTHEDEFIHLGTAGSSRHDAAGLWHDRFLPSAAEPNIEAAPGVGRWLRGRDPLDDSFEGVFAPDTSEGRWPPSLTAVTAFEQGLRSFLEQELARWTGRDDAYAVRSIRGILDNLRLFRRQYFGVGRDGSRLLHVNWFPNPATEGYDEDYDWLEEFVSVGDGGFWFCRVSYDPEQRRYHRLSWNGEA
jgi:hypothetical protein